MSDAPALPRVERAWPTGAFAVSFGCGLASLVGSAALVASSDSVGRAAALVGVFALLACLEGVVCVDAVGPWLLGNPVTPRTWMLQLGVVLLVLVTFAGGPAMAGSAFCGLLAGVLLPLASAIRYSRLNRDLVEEDERLAQELAVRRPPEETSKVRSGRMPQVGPVLRESVSDARDRSLAWAAATGVVALGGVAVGATAPVVLGMVVVGLAALAWVYRWLLQVWFALRDFEGTATEPRRAFVILLTDPRPRTSRPLLGVWSEEPLPVDGRLPLAEAVYRCQVEQNALVSTQGAVVVHEAWVDAGAGAGTGPRVGPRWVTADAGLALPYRKAVLGARYLDSLIGTERPARARPLTMAAPNPTTETATAAPVRAVTETTSGTGPWVRMFALRVTGLVLVGVVLAQWKAWLS